MFSIALGIYPFICHWIFRLHPYCSCCNMPRNKVLWELILLFFIEYELEILSPTKNDGSMVTICQQLLLAVFLIYAIHTCEMISDCCFVYISLIVNDVKHFLICQLDISMSFSRKDKIFSSILMGFWGLTLNLWALFVILSDVLYKYVLHSNRVSF